MAGKSEAYRNTKAAIEASPTEVVDNGRNTIARVNHHGLTEKQEMFAQGVAKGLTLKAAYVASYDTKTANEATIYQAASRMMDDPKIATRVRSLMAQRQERHAIDAMRVRRHVFDRLMLESVDEDSPAAARLKALELLGKIDVVSMFKEQRGPEKDDGFDPVALEEKLREALGKLIDVSPGTNGHRKTNDDTEHSSGEE